MFVQMPAIDVHDGSRWFFNDNESRKKNKRIQILHWKNKNWQNNEAYFLDIIEKEEKFQQKLLPGKLFQYEMNN